MKARAELANQLLAALRERGFEETGTGGNCRAMALDRRDVGLLLLVTDGDAGVDWVDWSDAVVCLSASNADGYGVDLADLFDRDNVAADGTLDFPLDEDGLESALARIDALLRVTAPEVAACELV